MDRHSNQDYVFPKEELSQRKRGEQAEVVFFLPGQVCAELGLLHNEGWLSAQEGATGVPLAAPPLAHCSGIKQAITRQSCNGYPGRETAETKSGQYRREAMLWPV